MLTYLEGQTVAIDVPLIDAQGAPFSASSASYRLLDEEGTVIVATTALTPWLSSFDVATIPVSGLNNTLAAGVPRGIRFVELFAVSDAGTIIVTAEYGLVSTSPLVVPTDSFVSYGSALLIAVTIPEMDSWDAANKAQRMAALMQAKRNIESIRFRYTPGDWMDRIEARFSGFLVDITPQEFAELPAEFIAALNVASVMEAENLMRDDTAKLRDTGVIQRTVGESSMMFRSVTPAKRAICDRAWSMLARFMDSRKIAIGRA